jgi:hypothetical protein
MTFRNPLGITETTRAVYDPLGNYIPFQAPGDPRPPAGSYSSASMSGLSSSQANAESYGVGCVMDGIPTNCKKVMDQLEKGRGKKLEILGPALTSSVTRLMMSLTPVGAEFVPSSAPNKPIASGESSGGYGYTISIGSSELWTYYILAPGMQRGFEQNRPTTKPQNSTPLPGSEVDRLKSALASVLKDSKCSSFVEALLKQISADTNRKAFSNKIGDIFDAVRKQRGFGKRAMSDTAEGGSTVGNGDAYINIGNWTFADNPYALASVGRTMIHELLHVGSGTNLDYSHYEMFKAAYAVAQRQEGFTLDRKPGPKDPGGRDIPNAYAFDNILFQACRVR